VVELRQSSCELCIREVICWQICWHFSFFRPCQLEKLLTSSSLKLAPAVGFEPTTNRLTADRSTTELRWILFLRDYGAWILRCAIFGGKSFLAHKIAAETGGRAGNRSLLKNLVAGAAPPWRGAALKIFGDQLTYKSRFLLFAF
jgi:hypothetical protein